MGRGGRRLHGLLDGERRHDADRAHYRVHTTRAGSIAVAFASGAAGANSRPRASSWTPFRGDVYAVDVQLGGSVHRALCKRSGRLVKFKIKLVAGDLVTVELSPYDTGRGRIVYRSARKEGVNPG